VPEFKIEGDALRREARFRMLSWGAVLLLLTTTGVLFALGVSGDLSATPDLGLLFVFTLLGTVIGAVILACREALHLAERQMVFILNGNGIVRKRHGFPDVGIAFSEVEILKEELGRLVIKTRELQKTIAIPNNVKGYEVIRAELEKHHSISSTAPVPLKSFGLLAASILSWVAVMWFADVRIVIPAGAIGLVTLAFGSHRLWTLVRRYSPRWLLWGSIGLAWLIAVLLIYLRVRRCR
jgi:hypothetical protein